jgi:hypothetical protein
MPVKVECAGLMVICRMVDKLVDDPFRSLADALRRAGGFAKDTNCCTICM